jgi:hypothetical protein
VPPPNPPMALLLMEHAATPGDSQEFFQVSGQSATMQVSIASDPALGSSDGFSHSASSSANMQIDIAVCWSEHDYPYLSTDNPGAISAEVRTVCDRFIDAVHVKGWLWRWSNGQWWLIGQPSQMTNYGWYRANANPSVGCPGSAAGGFYYTTTGYHEMWWQGQMRSGNSSSDKLSWIRCGGPY